MLIDVALPALVFPITSVETANLMWLIGAWFTLGDRAEVFQPPEVPAWVIRDDGSGGGGRPLPAVTALFNKGLRREQARQG